MNTDNEIRVKDIGNGEYKLIITFSDGKKVSTECKKIDLEKTIEEEIRKVKGHL